MPMHRPVIDHDHKTGAVRGILCIACNVAMSVVDRPEFLAKLLEYKAVCKGRDLR